MMWTVKGARAANHAPVVIVNGNQRPEPLVVSAEGTESIFLDASDSYDPDGDQLTFMWFHVSEANSSARGCY